MIRPPLFNWTVALKQPPHPTTSHMTGGIVSADVSRCQTVSEERQPEPAKSEARRLPDCDGSCYHPAQPLGPVLGGAVLTYVVGVLKEIG